MGRPEGRQATRTRAARQQERADLAGREPPPAAGRRRDLSRFRPAWGRALGDWLGGSTLVKGDGVVTLGVRSGTISKQGREQTDEGTSPSCVGASHGRHVVQLLYLPSGNHPPTGPLGGRRKPSRPPVGRGW